MRRRMSQAVIAEKVGVSQTMVSFVLSGKPVGVSEDKAQAILKLAHKNNYFRKSPPVQPTGSICLVASSNAITADPYYLRFISGIQAALADSKRHLMFATFEDGFPDAALASKVDGFVVQAKGLTTLDLERIASNRPLVLLNTGGVNESYDTVSPDDVGGTAQAVRHLAALGHRKIAFLSLVPFHAHSVKRHEGFLNAMRELALPVPDEFLILPMVKERSTEETARLVGAALDKLRATGMPTAIVTSGDVYALELLKAARDRGIRIPEDLSVTGYDNIISCEYASPPLTSVNQPMEDMGAQAVRLLLERVADKRLPPRAVTFKVELKIRGSTDKTHRGNTPRGR